MPRERLRRVVVRGATLTFLFVLSLFFRFLSQKADQGRAINKPPVVKAVRHFSSSMYTYALMSPVVRRSIAFFHCLKRTFQEPSPVFAKYDTVPRIGCAWRSAAARAGFTECIQLAANKSPSRSISKQEFGDRTFLNFFVKHYHNSSVVYLLLVTLWRTFYHSVAPSSQHL